MNAQLRAVPDPEPVTARDLLRAAHQALTKAASLAQQARERQQRLIDLGNAGADADKELADARDAHADTLKAWAEAGAKGDAPKPPARLAQLESRVLTARSEAEAANAAAHAMQGAVDAAQAEADKALREMEVRRVAVIAEELAALADEYRAGVLRVNSLREHISGLGRISGELLPHNPGITRLPVGDILRFQPELVPDGAEASRQAWRDLVAALAGNAEATLGPAPASIDRFFPTTQTAGVAQ